MPNNEDYYKAEKIIRNIIFGVAGIGFIFGLILLFSGYGEERIIGLVMLASSIGTVALCFIWGTIEDIAIESRNMRMMHERQMANRQQPPAPRN